MYHCAYMTLDRRPIRRFARKRPYSSPSRKGDGMFAGMFFGIRQHRVEVFSLDAGVSQGLRHPSSAQAPPPHRACLGLREQAVVYIAQFGETHRHRVDIEWLPLPAPLANLALAIGRQTGARGCISLDIM